MHYLIAMYETKVYVFYKMILVVILKIIMLPTSIKAKYGGAK